MFSWSILNTLSDSGVTELFLQTEQWLHHEKLNVNQESNVCPRISHGQKGASMIRILELKNINVTTL